MFDFLFKETRRVKKQIDVQLVKAKVQLSDGSTEEITTKGWAYFGSPQCFGVVRYCGEDIFNNRLRENFNFKTKDGGEIMSRHIVKILEKKVEPSIVRYEEVYAKPFLLPEELYFYEELGE